MLVSLAPFIFHSTPCDSEIFKTCVSRAFECLVHSWTNRFYSDKSEFQKKNVLLKLGCSKNMSLPFMKKRQFYQIQCKPILMLP